MTEKKVLNQDSNGNFGNHNSNGQIDSNKVNLTCYSYGGFSKLNPKKKTK